MASICNYGCRHPEHKREVSQSEITKLATEGLKDLIGTIKAADKSRIRFLSRFRRDRNDKSETKLVAANIKI